MKPAIRVDNLSKRYRLGTSKSAGYRTLRETVTESAAGAWHGLRRRLGGSVNGNGSARDDAFWALKDVSFEVQPGEVVGIIGRNGAGKSTLLKILSRIVEPTAGRCEVRGRMASLLEVGTGFHPELTGRENIYMNGSILGMSRKEIDRKFDEIVAFSEIEQFLDTPVKRYSSGMYVRLAFAVAAHLEPEILVVDEVLAVGDAGFQRKCIGKMDEVARQGRTVLLVSHNAQAIQWLCKQAILLAKGQVVKLGPTDTVLSGYLGDASNSTTGFFDLIEHPARPTGVRPMLTRLVLSAGGTPTTQFNPENRLEVEITIEPRGVIRSPRIAVAIEDNMGRRIMTFANYFGPMIQRDIIGPTRMKCSVPRLGLGTGRYLLSVSIGTRTGPLDDLHNAAWFEICWNNNYGNGEPYHSIYGPVLAESDWLIVD